MLIGVKHDVDGGLTLQEVDNRNEAKKWLQQSSSEKLAKIKAEEASNVDIDREQDFYSPTYERNLNDYIKECVAEIEDIDDTGLFNDELVEELAIQ